MRSERKNSGDSSSRTHYHCSSRSPEYPSLQAISPDHLFAVYRYIMYIHIYIIPHNPGQDCVEVLLLGSSVPAGA